MKIKTKEVSRLSRKIGSAMLAGVLAMGMCVPAMSVAMLNQPGVAVAAEGSEYTYTIEQVYNNHEGLLNLSVENGVLKISADSSLGNQGGGSYIVPCLVASPETNLENEATAESVPMTSPGVYYVKIAWSTLGTIDANACPLVETDGGWEENKYPYDTLNMACYKVTVTDLSAAPVVLNRSLDITKESAQGGVLAVENTDSVKVEYAAAPAGVDTLKVGDKTAALTAADGVSSAAVSIADLGEGSYPVAVYEAAAPTNTDIEGILTVSEAGKVSISLISTEGTAKGTSYSVFKIFDADVDGKITDVTAPKGSNVEFATGVTGDIIKGTSDDTRDFSVAQNAAEFINENIAHQPGVGLNAGSYGTELAKRLMAAGLTPIAVTADAEAVTELAGEGYYLIVKTDDLTGENTVASSPIYVALDEGVSTIKLKSAIPTVIKQIKEDSTGEWGITADSSLGQAVDYKITGTVAENVAAYDTYAYKFVDTLEAGKLAVDTASVNVTVDGKDVTAQATVKYEGDVLTVEFADLKNLTDGTDKIAITPDTAVVLTYTASIVAASDVAGDGNENGVVLHYANNPVLDSMGYTKESKVRDFTYALNLNKVDHKTAAPMKDVEFSFKNTDGKYLNADGSESDTEVFIATDDEGKINITHIDADTYTVAEKTPDGYRDLAEFTVTIAPTYGDDEAAPTLQKVTALDGNFNAEVDATYVNNLTKDADAGLVDWTVRNVKYVDLPITGEEGIFLLTLLGITLVAGGVTISVLRRKEQF